MPSNLQDPKGPELLKLAVWSKKIKISIVSKTMASALICATPASCLEFFNDTIPSMNLKEPALGLPLSSALFSDTADKCGLKERSTRGQHFISPFQDDKEIRERPAINR